MSWKTIPVTTFLGIVQFLIGQVKRKKDAMLACHGGEGTGKSTTAKNLARALEKMLGVKAVTIFTLEQLLEVMGSGKKRQLYILDEAVNIFHNQDWSTWQAKAITKIIRQMRIMESIWILNCPDFEGLHPYLRDFRIIMRLYHPPEWQADGLGNGPAKLLTKQERLDYKSGHVETRWLDAGDIHSRCMDDDPEWASYEQDKVQNFQRLVKAMQDRLKQEKAKETAAKARKAKAQAKKKPQTKKNAAKPAKAAPPPTTT